jgi:DNA-binding transcriptional MerR regulator
MAESFSIGDLARLTGTKIETIRYYESIGLLPAVARTSAIIGATPAPTLSG